MATLDYKINKEEEEERKNNFLATKSWTLKGKECTYFLSKVGHCEDLCLEFYLLKFEIYTS